MDRLNDRCAVKDSVCNVVQNDDLAKSLNTLRTVPGAPNPFAISQKVRIASQVKPSQAVTHDKKSYSR